MLISLGKTHLYFSCFFCGWNWGRYLWGSGFVFFFWRAVDFKGNQEETELPSHSIWGLLCIYSSISKPPIFHIVYGAQFYEFPGHFHNKQCRDKGDKRNASHILLGLDRSMEKLWLTWNDTGRMGLADDMGLSENRAPWNSWRHIRRNHDCPYESWRFRMF